ncbi:hypothetical protein [Alkalimarinus sediminis]|uniref:Uncharacterized protein n=1 Tax=Alkalimarinus sediminis TaxID=1632866 RepID=A0A9E8HKL8_9ALTE|nr:hypothetical protein [Alkalimarinus sediminis]UZW74536.1 hypothetical protein NNL22_16155 [Alkalimarinus sediminis]
MKKLIIALLVFLRLIPNSQLKTASIGKASIKVPNGWTIKSTEGDKVILLSKNGREQSTISTLNITDEASFVDFETLCKIRIEEERKSFEDGFVNAQEPFDSENTYVMFYSGGDKETGRLFSGCLSLSQNELITTYVESMGGEPKEHLSSFKLMVGAISK